VKLLYRRHFPSGLGDLDAVGDQYDAVADDIEAYRSL